jgi:2-C-methyl-D-erythritol 4-phosphate cytidylyltransferase
LLNVSNAWGVVPERGRGSLPFALVLGESLVATASFALEGAGVALLDPHASAAIVRCSGRMLVLHDPLCALTPVEFLVDAVDRSTSTGAVVVGHRPVTDTVKESLPGQVGPTVDRAGLVEVTSPVVLPATVLAELDDGRLDALVRGPAADFSALVDRLARRWPVELVEAPPLGRRLRSADELGLLEALSAAVRPAG